MRFLLSGLGITKLAVVVLIIVALAGLGIGVYAVRHITSPNVSPTPIPLPLPTVTPTPTFTYAVTPKSEPTPTPTATSTAKPTAIPTPTSSIKPAPTLIPNPTKPITPEKVRDSTMYYIESEHPETAQFMKNLIWTGGRVTLPNVMGAETYMYYSLGWNVTITYPVVPNAIYRIAADYSAVGISIPYRIIWKGTWQNEVVNETSYVFAQ